MQARSLPVLANTNAGRWEAERDAALNLELTRRMIVQHVTNWLACEESDIRYAETSNIRPLLPLTGNKMKPLNSFQFRTSFWWTYSGFQWDEIIRRVTSTVLLSVQGSDVTPELVWTIIRRIHWIATIMYTMRNTEKFCRCQGGGGESAGRNCRSLVAVLISSCIERTQGPGCGFEIFTVQKFPASDQPGGILTFSGNQCRSVW